MLFRSRKEAGVGERVGRLLWPRRSFWRSGLYFTKRVLRLTAAPHAVAAGVAAGVFASFLPFVGFHFIIAAAAAWLLKGNVVASAFGTAAGNPVTFPFIWTATLGLGRIVLDGGHAGLIETVDVGHFHSNAGFAGLWEPLIKPMTVGGVLLGALFGLLFYVVTRYAINRFRGRKKLRLDARKSSRELVSAGAESVLDR
ncbi:MAG: DUF2062 domain-containing protein [Rhizobiaceae bacterium]